LLYLSRSHDRKWDDLDKAWDALHDFIEPRLGRRASKIPSDERLEKWRSKEYYPFEQILALNLSTNEVNMLMRSVCAQIANMEPEPERGTFEKHKYQIFYYDLDNHNVRINVDTVASFRAAVEEMFTYRTSEPRIEFCFRVKEGLSRLV
jgi:hypothetical protein